jgi:hypothetical protein
MNRQQQIDGFLLEAHRLAVQRLDLLRRARSG